MDNQQLVTRRENAIGKGAPLFYEEPLHIVRGEGTYLFDADGKRYIDMVATDSYIVSTADFEGLRWAKI